MADIWLAALKGVEGFRKPLVLKRILREHSQRSAFIQMLIQEAKVCSQLKHNNIVQIFELGQVSGEYFIAMEYVAGWDLLRVLFQASTLRKPLPLELVLHVCIELARGLEHAHTATDVNGKPLGVVHLDLSPSNVLLSRDGTIKLTDFGVARANFERGVNALSGSQRGKLAYMSPEQVAGASIDHRSDLFALGIVLYEMLTLKRLFKSHSPVKTMANIRAADIETRLARHPEIPESIATILRRAISADLGTRYETAGQMADDLTAALFDHGQHVSGGAVGRFLQEMMAEEPTRKSNTIRQPTRTMSESWHQALVTRTNAIGSVRMREATRTRTELLELRTAQFVFKEKIPRISQNPMSYSDVLRLVMDKAVRPDQLVSVNGSEWRPLREITTMAEAVSEFIGKDQDALTTRFFDRFSAIGLYSTIAAERMTGRLRIVREGLTREIFFVKGRVLSTRSDRRKERLGYWLLERGVINDVQLTLAYNQVQNYDEGIGPELVRLGFIDSQQLYAQATQRMVDAVTDAFTWRGGQSAFVIEDPPVDAAPFDLDILPLIGRAIRNTFSDDAIRGYFSRLGNPRTHKNKTDPFPLESLELTATEARQLRHLVGPAIPVRDHLREASKRAPEERRAMLVVLLLLHQTGHLLSVQSLPSKW
jgi:serine/threonine-protein kinase